MSPAGSETRSSRARRPLLWPPIVVVGAFYFVFVGLRLAQEGVLWFVHLGRQTLESAGTSSALADLEWQSEIGYDGQYYFALAVDPANASDYMDGKAGYVYARPFFPALSRLVSLGQVDYVPHAMLLINVSAVLLGTAALAAWLRRNDVSPWFSAIYGLYPGLVFSVFHDLTEPLAYGLVAIALWFFDPKDGRRLAAAAATLSLAALTRETVVLFALVGAAALVHRRIDDRGRRWSWSRWRRPVAFLVVTTAPLLAWKAIVGAVLQEPAQESPGGAVALIPFYGIASYWPWGAPPHARCRLRRCPDRARNGRRPAAPHRHAVETLRRPAHAQRRGVRRLPPEGGLRGLRGGRSRRNRCRFGHDLLHSRLEGCQWGAASPSPCQPDVVPALVFPRRGRPRPSGFGAAHLVTRRFASGRRPRVRRAEPRLVVLSGVMRRNRARAGRLPDSRGGSGSTRGRRARGGRRRR